MICRCARDVCPCHGYPLYDRYCRDCGGTGKLNGPEPALPEELNAVIRDACREQWLKMLQEEGGEG
jgi:hypothetical protein